MYKLLYGHSPLISLASISRCGIAELRSNFELDYLLLAAESSYLIHVKVNNTKRKFLASAHTQAASR